MTHNTTQHGIGSGVKSVSAQSLNQNPEHIHIPPLKDTRAGLPEGRGEVAHCDRRVMCVVCCVLRGRHGAAVRGVDEAQGAGEADQAAAYRP